VVAAGLAAEALRGVECSRRWRVEEGHAALHLKERGVKVLSTPSLLLMFEVTARECVDSRLPEGLLTVGTMALIRHTSPAPVGSEVEVRVRVVGSEGRRLSIYGEARLAGSGALVGEVYHERRIVALQEYLKRVEGAG
jgi:predicted thioesterase